jgi:hypothetical protein
LAEDDENAFDGVGMFGGEGGCETGVTEFDLISLEEVVETLGIFRLVLNS